MGGYSAAGYCSIPICIWDVDYRLLVLLFDGIPFSAVEFVLCFVEVVAVAEQGYQLVCSQAQCVVAELQLCCAELAVAD